MLCTIYSAYKTAGKKLLTVFILKREKETMEKILVNKIRCKKCGDTIESKTVHDFKFCKCGLVAVDGGHYYLRRIGK
jgi:hypothetical protein